MGRALAQFGAASDNRLVVTSNLSNAGLVTALFGGPTQDAEEIHGREARLINLLRIAAPNRALVSDGEAYQTLLSHALRGET